MHTLTLLTAAKPSNATQEVTFGNVCVCGGVPEVPRK